MPTSLVSTGVQFPDSTIQTTAASAGGTITATASGSISAGAPVIMNSAGTVSTITATGGSYTTGTSTTKTVTNYSAQNSTMSFDTVRNVVVLFYLDSQYYYLYAIPGTISGTSISWGTSVLITTYPTGVNTTSAPMTSVYASDVGLHACFWANSNVNQVYMSCVSVSAGGSISVVTAAQGVSVGMSYAYYPSVAYNAATSRIVYMCVDHTVFQQVGGFCGYLSSSGVLTSSPFVIEYSVTQAGPTSVTTTSTGKVIFYWESASSYPKAQIAQLPSSGNTLTNVSSSYTVNSASNSQKQLAVGIDIPTGNALFAYGSGADVYIKVASISGYTLSFGSPSSSVGVQSYGNYLAFFSMPGTNATLLFADTNGSTPLYAIPITVSGLTITIGSLQNSSSGGNYSSRPRATPDPVGLQFIVGGGNGSAVGGNTFTNVTTNLTSANFIGFSSASYTNGQTATINVVGSTNSSQSGLTAGLKYYVLGGGTLNSGATSNPYAGLARSSTSILVKG